MLRKQQLHYLGFLDAITYMHSYHGIFDNFELHVLLG